MSNFQSPEPFYKRHKGPYRFLVSRPPIKGKSDRMGWFRGGKSDSTEWLKGSMPGEEVESEAISLMTDPRDSINWVGVWSVKEEQFVFQFGKAKEV